MNCSSNSFKEKFPPRVEAETHKFEALWKFPDHKNSREMLFLTQIIINNLLSSPLLTGYKLMSGHLAFGLTSYLLYSTSHLFQHQHNSLPSSAKSLVDIVLFESKFGRL